MSMDQLLARTGHQGDLLIEVGLPPILDTGLDLLPIDDSRLSAEDCESLLRPLLGPRQSDQLQREGWTRFVFTTDRGVQARATVYAQRDALNGCFRVIPLEARGRESLGLPPLERLLGSGAKGLVAVTGARASGVSTTLHWMVDYINETQRTHILTLEDTIETSHYHKLSILSQRQRGDDFEHLGRAIRETSRQGAKVVMIDELHGRGAIREALFLAHSGQLVLAGMTAWDVTDAAKILFGEAGHASSLGRMSDGLAAITYQCLVRGKRGSRTLAMAVLKSTGTVQSHIREGKWAHLYTTMETGFRTGMQTLEQALAAGVTAELYSRDEALRHSRAPERLMELLSLER